MNVKLYAHPDSTPVVIANVRRTSVRGGLYTVHGNDGFTYRFPTSQIFMVTEEK